MSKLTFGVMSVMMFGYVADIFWKQDLVRQETIHLNPILSGLLTTH